MQGPDPVQGLGLDPTALDLIALQDGINRQAFLEMQGHDYVIHDGPVEPYHPVTVSVPESRRIAPNTWYWWGGAPDLSVVKEIAARYCPATPTWPLPTLRGFGSMVKEAVDWRFNPGGMWVEHHRRMWREREAQAMHEYIEGVITNAEWVTSDPGATLMDLVIPRYYGKP